MDDPRLLFAIRPDNYGTLWPPELYKKEVYFSRLTQLYETQFRPLLQQLLDTGIDAYAASASRASQMNAIRWYLPDAGEKAEEIREYMQQRLAMLDRMWIRGEAYCMILIQEPSGVEKLCALAKGETLDFLPAYTDTPQMRFFGWHDRKTGAPVDPEKPVYGDMTVYMEYEALPVPQEETQQPQEEPFRLTQLAAAAGFAAMLLLLLAAEGCRQYMDCVPLKKKRR